MSVLAIISLVQALLGTFAAVAGPGPDGTGGLISIEVQRLLYGILGVSVPSTVAGHAFRQTKMETKVEKTAEKVDSAVQEVVEVRRAQALMSNYPPQPTHVRKS
jgi:hypothetical protein